MPAPGPIVVSGPGPIEPGTDPAPSPLTMNTSKPAPPLPPDSAGEHGSLEREASVADEDEDEDEDAGFAKGKASPVHQLTATDPYAGLNSAFGEYAVDTPHPASSQTGHDAGDLF
jgi:AP-2 complex subunit beta-1